MNRSGAEANARLIAMAPEMLAVLKEIAWHIEGHIEEGSAILAAIAKATGQEEGR